MQFWFTTNKTPQTLGDLASAKLPLEDSKVKSFKKEMENKRNTSVFISTGIRNIIVLSETFSLVQTRWLVRHTLLKHKPKICLIGGLKKTTCHWKEGAVSALLEWTHDVSKITTFGLVKFVLLFKTSYMKYLEAKQVILIFFFFQKRPSHWAHSKN